MSVSDFDMEAVRAALSEPASSSLLAELPSDTPASSRAFLSALASPGPSSDLAALGASAWRALHAKARSELQVKLFNLLFPHPNALTAVVSRVSSAPEELTAWSLLCEACASSSELRSALRNDADQTVPWLCDLSYAARRWAEVPGLRSDYAAGWDPLEGRARAEAEALPAEAPRGNLQSRIRDQLNREDPGHASRDVLEEAGLGRGALSTEGSDLAPEPFRIVRNPSRSWADLTERFPSTGGVPSQEDVLTTLGAAPGARQAIAGLQYRLSDCETLFRGTAGEPRAPEPAFGIAWVRPTDPPFQLPRDSVLALEYAPGLPSLKSTPPVLLCSLPALAGELDVSNREPRGHPSGRRKSGGRDRSRSRSRGAARGGGDAPSPGPSRRFDLASSSAAVEVDNRDLFCFKIVPFVERNFRDFEERYGRGGIPTPSDIVAALASVHGAESSIVGFLPADDFRPALESLRRRDIGERVGTNQLSFGTVWITNRTARIGDHQSLFFLLPVRLDPPPLDRSFICNFAVLARRARGGRPERPRSRSRSRSRSMDRQGGSRPRPRRDAPSRELSRPDVAEDYFKCTVHRFFGKARGKYEDEIARRWGAEGPNERQLVDFLENPDVLGPGAVVGIQWSGCTVFGSVVYLRTHAISSLRFCSPFYMSVHRDTEGALLPAVCPREALLRNRPWAS